MTSDVKTIYRRALAIAGMAGLTLGMGAADRAPQTPTGRATDFTSVEYYPAPYQLQMKSRMSGADVQALEGGLLVVRGLKLEMFTTNGQPQVVVRASSCIYDANKGEANSPGHLLLQNGDGRVQVEGEGFLWRQNDSFLAISNEVRTKIDSDLKDRFSP